MKVRLRARAVWDCLVVKNMSQNELARRLGITSGYLSLLINGRRGPSPSLRQRIQAELSDVSFSDLFMIEHTDSRDADGREWHDG